MAPSISRLSAILAHINPRTAADSTESLDNAPHVHQLSPTFFLQRAAQLEPNALAVYHVTANDVELQRTYAELAQRAQALASYLRSRGWTRVGVLAPNTPAFLERLVFYPPNS